MIQWPQIRHLLRGPFFLSGLVCPLIGLIALSLLLLLQCLQVEFFSIGLGLPASGRLQGLVLAAGGRCGYLLEHLYLVACAKLPRHQVSRYLCPAKRHIEGRREAIRCLYQKLN